MKTLVLMAAVILVFVAARAGSLGAISLNEANPRLGATVTFAYTAPDGIRDDCANQQACLRIQLLCYQGVQPVYGQQELAMGNSFLLGGGSSDWINNGLPADCTATLYQWRKAGKEFVGYVSTTFHAEGAP